MPRSVSPSNNPATPSRRLLSRIASPFTSKSRNVTEYHIKVDDPHRQYSPGDSVTGALHIHVAKPVRVTHIVVCLHGFVQVYKNPGAPPADAYRTNSAHIGTGRGGSRSGEYFGNGFASLFEDEVVVCGDGRLGEGQYRFEFNLEFPDKDLPSSISFERGTISYMITATLTRPTTMSPTMQCDQKVYLVERIDISQLYPPKARTITLEPLSRRSRARTHAKKLVDSDRKSRKSDSNQLSSERRDSQTSSSPSLRPVGEGIHSPSPSEISFDSHNSSGARNSHQDSNATSTRQSEGGKAATSSSLPSRTITATVESLMGGCLRGDSVPVKVHVNHTKHVKSLHGVIITLYRQARVDMHPTIPLGPTEKGKEAKYEDYYPKSVTGLGGLSLSGAGSSHVFRKDLSQTTVPLIVDPASLTAEVTGRVHVPEEAFPTISTVPGAMISFRYYIEVVLDIQGKLQSQDRNLGNLGGLASTINTGQATESLNRERSVNNTYGSPVIDTATVRRDKGVVACTFEVIVGTRDSERRKGKRKVEIIPESQRETPQRSQQETQPGATTDNDASYQGNGWHGSEHGHDYQYYYNLSPYAQQGHPVYNGYDGYSGHYDQYGYAYQDASYTEPPPMPVPPMEDESQLSEKERMRRAEARLLPSQPPGAEDSQATAGASGPSAPYLPEEQAHGYFAGASAPDAALLAPPPLHAGPSTNGSSSVIQDFASGIPLPRTPDCERMGRPSPSYTNGMQPSAPAYEARDPSVLSPQTSSQSRTTIMPPTDDKRELERRHLQMEASAPPEDEAGPAPSEDEPSAPVLNEDDELYTSHNDSHADASGSSDLPRYER